MKNYAQAILLFTGYPLEPIVALEIKKCFQLQDAARPTEFHGNSYTKKRNTSRLLNAAKKQKSSSK